MADIISYFKRNDALSAAEGIDVFEFSGNAVEFVKDCVQRFREAYISEEKISRILSHSQNTTRRDSIERRLPKQPQNIAGDFGEILSYYLWTENWASDANICPMKIRWKEHPDMPGHLVDVILLKKTDVNKARPDDKMYTIESKVWTSPMGANKSSLTDALIGAIKDSTERAAKTIPYLVSQYERDDEYDLADQVQRFGDPVNDPYIKEHYAVAMVDASQTNAHVGNFDKKLHSSFPNIPVFLFPFTELKVIYKTLFQDIPNH